jgi:hypothetical protein
MGELTTREFWKSINPDLTISDYVFRRELFPLDMASESAERYIDQIREDGYFKLESVLPAMIMQRLYKAVVTLVNYGIPPAFINVYNEPWQVFKSISPLMERILGPDCRIGIGVWTFYIPPTNDSKGFPAHRDEIKTVTEEEDGTPLVATAWIPLADVTTDHSCIYLLPTSKDENVPYNLSDTNIPTKSLGDIRALPCKAGSVICWNASILHWGSSSSAAAGTPRISIAANYKAAHEPCSISISMDPSQTLPLELRLGIIGAGLSAYNKSTIDESTYPRKLIELCRPYTQKYLVQPDAAVDPDSNDIYVYEFKKRAAAGGNTGPTGAPAGGYDIPNASTARMASKGLPAGRDDPCPCGSGKKYKNCHG